MGAALSSILQKSAGTAEDVQATVAEAITAGDDGAAMAQEPPAAIAPSAAVAGKGPEAAAKPEVADSSPAASAASGSSAGTSSGEESASDVEGTEEERGNPVAAGSGLTTAQPAVVRVAGPTVSQATDSKDANPPKGRFKLWGRQR